MKRAQITMESLLLYGAAILVVLLAIAALTYFGVFDLGNLLPSKCNLEDTQMFKCDEYQYKTLVGAGTSPEVSIVVRNIASKPILIESASFAPQDAGYFSCSAGTFAPATVTPGATSTITFECSPFPPKAGDKVKGVITLTSKYVGGTLSTTTTGSVTAKVA